MNGTSGGRENHNDLDDFTEISIPLEVDAMAGAVQSDNGPRPEKKKDKHVGIENDTYKHHLTNVAHCCILTYTVLVVYLCIKHPIEFFTWHPLLMSIGWTLLMTEAVLMLSKENVIPKQLKLNHTIKERLHWVFLTIGALLIAAGFIVVTISKNEKNKEHYTSWHGIFGLIGMIAYIPPCINGIPLLYRRDIGDYVNIRIVKFVHIIGGIVSLTCGGLSLLLSVYTKWFARHTQQSQFIFYFSLLIVAFPVIWTIQRPLLKCVRGVFNPPKPKHKRGKHEKPRP
ncbi:hypothetical protein NQ318_015376 [Aromia moschata]|uniref:ascorbate ferrireductase (transmembrane) n=1 Tax=Aromia moschata TaxID=1265417 RepID=A0AAV8YMA3_9CUCU|nr:hypothetical protein NQ318_015376 [Aromia moschata]